MCRVLDKLSNIQACYFKLDDQGTLEIATDAWSQWGFAEQDFRIGEIYRFAMLAAFRLGKQAGHEQKHYAEGLTWKSRARVVFGLTACHAGEAMMLIPDAYAIAFEFHAIDLGIETLHGMKPLLEADEANQQPERIVYRRIPARCYPEKLGFLHFRNNHYAEALGWYQIALEKAKSDPRAFMKVQLGAAVCRFGLESHSHDPTAKQHLVDEMQRLLKSGQDAGFGDICTVASRNLELTQDTLRASDLHFVEI